jgi:hypothetical protein
MGDTNQLGIDYATGATFIGDSATRTGRWCAITFTSNATVDTLVIQNWDGSSVAGQSFDAGITLYGVFTSIKLQNGHCVAYKI